MQYYTDILLFGERIRLTQKSWRTDIHVDRTCTRRIFKDIIRAVCMTNHKLINVQYELFQWTISGKMPNETSNSAFSCDKCQLFTHTINRIRFIVWISITNTFVYTTQSTKSFHPVANSLDRLERPSECLFVEFQSQRYSNNSSNYQQLQVIQVQVHIVYGTYSHHLAVAAVRVSQRSGKCFDHLNWNIVCHLL